MANKIGEVMNRHPSLILKKFKTEKSQEDSVEKAKSKKSKKSKRSSHRRDSRMDALQALYNKKHGPHIRMKEQLINENLKKQKARQRDQDGRLIRWQRFHDAEDEITIGCCQSEELIYMNMSDYTAVRKLEAFNEIIYKKMERRKAAI